MATRQDSRSSRRRGLFGLVAAAALSGAALAAAQPTGFYLERLPKGKNVTIPKPATTFVPLSSRVMLTATDMPQSVSFRPVNVGSGPTRPIRLSIYDRSSERVQYIDVKPGTPFLYTFRELGTITVVPESTGADGSLSLQVESNKPLEIAH